MLDVVAHLVLGEGAAEQIRTVLDRREEDYAGQPGLGHG